MLNGILNLSFWGDVIALLLLTHLTVLSVTLYLHRSQAHRAMDIHPLLAHVFRFWLWLTTGMVTSEWVAIHRKHHAKCETAEDPHSPVVLGIKKVFWEGAELYRTATKDKTIVERYGHGCPNDWIERHLYAKHSRLGIVLMLLIDLMLFGIGGISIWALQMIWIPVWAAGFINGIGHYWGYRNFECSDAARNIIPWGIISGGEELHNNHHTFGTSAKFSVKWWEFDIGWAYICVFKSLGLVKVRKTIPKLVKADYKNSIDVETVKAFVANRFQIMASYANEVILPILDKETTAFSANSRQLIHRAKRLLVRDLSLVNAEGKATLDVILKEPTQVQTVYQFKLKLQAIWDKTTASQKELVEALQEWCQQAEATGIERLRDFVKQLAQYQYRINSSSSA